ncbi:MAG: hypothetical protein OEV00_04960 [Acidobacteriota bacterium]|nr:hypothetical protein [Acidobacteriota bacterium]MDH3784665.1 hypothetical protein [Acidobacteriota bacterium]
MSDPGQEWRAATETAAVVARTGYRLLSAAGPDMLPLLNRLSTGEVLDLPPGAGAQTVLTSAKGRVIERFWVHQAGDGPLWLIGGCGDAQPILDHFMRYTFAEQTDLTDRSADHRLFSVIGPRSRDLIDRWLPTTLGPLGIAATDRIHGPTWILGHDAHGTQGWSLLTDVDHADEARETLVADAATMGGSAIGSEIAECWRISSGLPATGFEISEKWNPLEAGLRDAVSFDKGCYIGQEVVARLHNYDKVSRSLVQLRWDDPGHGDIGSKLLHGDKTVGEVTSFIAHPEGGAIGLGLVKHRSLDARTPLAFSGADVAVTWNPLSQASS